MTKVEDNGAIGSSTNRAALADAGSRGSRLGRRLGEAEGRASAELTLEPRVSLAARKSIGKFARRLAVASGIAWLATSACSDPESALTETRACTDGCGPCEVCKDGACVTLEDGAVCLDGRCHDGQCCTGCWDGAECREGNASRQCGMTGDLCQDCSLTKSECIERTCDLPCRFASVAVGRWASYALRPNHRLYAWGRGDSGQLGLGATTNATTPTSVTTSDRWRRIAAGEAHACAVVTGDELYCWGNNSRGQLGLDDSNQRNVPTRLPSDTPFDLIAAAGHSTCAIDRLGALYCWGDNALGQLGLGASAADAVTKPTRVGSADDWSAIALGSGFACGIRAPGTLYCWGTNTTSRLGIGSSDTALVERAPKRIGSEGDWSTVSLGAQHACATKLDGTLRCWGDNAHGQLGTNDRELSASPTSVGTGRWQQLALADNHSCGIDSMGDLFCWGVAASGTGANDVLKPTAVAQGTHYVAVSARGNTTCALTDRGTLQCWGDNASGATGNSTKVVVSSPTPTCIAAPAGTLDVDVDAGTNSDAGAVAPEVCPATPDCTLAVCAGKPCGQHGQICAAGACTCQGNKAHETACGDGKDDDCDGHVDCADSDCSTLACGDQAYQRCCGGACVDTSTNASHCQGCGLACASGHSCKRITDESGTRGHCTCDGNGNCPKNPGQICRAGNGDGQDGLCACDAVNQGNSGCASGQTCSNVAKANFCHY